MAVLAFGTITFGTTKFDAGIKNCNVLQISGIEDISVFHDPDAWKTKCATFKDWNGSMDIVWDSGNTGIIGETGALSVSITDGPAYSGNVIINTITDTVTKGTVCTQSVTFEGTGECHPHA
jgi:hypothetical protein